MKHGICSICGHEKDEELPLLLLHEFTYEKLSNKSYKRVCKLCGYSDVWVDTNLSYES